MNTRYAIEERLQSILAQLEKEDPVNQPFDQAECKIFNGLLTLGKMMLEYKVSLMNEQVIPNQFFHKEDGTFPSVKYVYKGESHCSYMSIFGKIDIKRKRYYSAQSHHSIFPLDQQLSLPANRVSYLLQDWLGQCSCEQTYEQSVRLLNKIFPLEMDSMQVHRMNESIYHYSQSTEEEVVKNLYKLITLLVAPLMVKVFLSGQTKQIVK